ncbi:ABC transporter permease subunit [Siminovitchia fortis]|uniref:ABC transporter permease n=1 Tax=Siminovitchia fortis TaxID=254758 RepID=A0A443IJ49_9BACI|nr:ABC transporter permease subunit [Siminovitchia fortis]RWR04379.1 ABC transporter permease [Siminovitchia fortis]WHY82524.1 ABC transporter permease subunit [Siminovitchia fortis]
MKQLLASEYERVFKKKKTIVGILIFCFVLAFECFFLYQMDVSFYDPEQVVPLNSINSAPFFLRELGVFLHFILIPMFVVDSFNGEYSSGALRLVLIRPQKRVNVLLAKWIVQASIFFMIMVFTWLVGTIFGRMLMPNVEETSFYQTGSMDAVGGLLYTLKFYAMAFLIVIAVIGLCSLISMLMPNPILAYAGTVVVLVGGIYIQDVFDYLFVPSDSIFAVLGKFQAGFYVSLFLIIAASCMINIGIWKKKQWMG